MFIADFHIHSKHSRATSRDCAPEMLDLWAARKGLHLLGTGDFTHPGWRQELKEKLLPAEEGLYILAKEFCSLEPVPADSPQPRFIISGEIASIYKQDGKVRKVHNVIVLPSLEAAETLSRRLEIIGNLHSDGRPILGLSSHDLLEITLESCEQAIFIPAHIWTPHFSLFGAYSGFDDIKECFGDLTGHIQALETGLSSDPPMNWRLSALDDFTLVSNSDAHSPAKLAREANIFNTELSYPHIARALQKRRHGEFFGTLEFFPEEGKYHYDGHRNCGVCFKPAETAAAAGLCPVCGGRITVGVLSRVEELADRPEGFIPPAAKNFESLVPLSEVITASAGFSALSQKGRKIYGDLLGELGTELFVLREAPLAEIEGLAGPLVAEGIRRLRAREVQLEPGHDGAYGKVRLIDETERQRILGQTHLFGSFKSETPQTQKTAINPTINSEADRVEDKTQFDTGELPGLNAEQQEAVNSSSPVTAVIAGPGTGKTRTLVARIVYLLREKGVKPAHITAVTFTNKAAAQMRKRLEEELRDKRAVRAMNIGTFHAICLRLLTARAGAVAATLISESDALLLLGDILRERGLAEAPRDVLRSISLLKNGALPDGAPKLIPAGVYEEYQRQLTAYGVLDYDDILRSALSLPGGGDKHFSHLLVDEFQDINRLQYRLLQSWGQGSVGIFVIGDPHQSIYGFRGSAAECFSWLATDYPDAKMVRLDKNYRSTPQIIGCAAAALSGQMGDSAAQVAAGQESGARVRLLMAGDATAEALAVTKEIGRMVGGLDMLESGRQAPEHPFYGFADIAVLYRTNRQAALFERYFKSEGIPYTVAGREAYLTEGQVLNTLAFFRLLINPADRLARRRCLQNLGEQGLEKLWEKYLPLAKKSKPGRLLKEWLKDNVLMGSPPLVMLLQAAALYDDIPDFLHNLALGQEADVLRSGAGRRERQAVSLMTLHAAKGLEFPVVFLAGLTEGLLPLRGRDGVCNTEEERRLLYVGMTRAEQELILLTSGAPCPFIASLPREALDTKQIRERKAPAAFEQASLFGKIG